MPSYTSDKLIAFFRQYPLRRYPKGQILFMPGDTPDHAYFLEEGNVKVYTHNYKADEVTLRSVGRDLFFPSAAIVTGVPLLYYYRAASDILVRTAPRDEVLAFIRSDNDVLFTLLCRAHLLLEQNKKKIHYLMAGNAKDLVTYELLHELHTNGDIDANGEYAINLTEQEIGNRAGLTRETVSREFKSLKEKGLVEKNGAQTIIKDVMELEKRLQEF